MIHHGAVYGERVPFKGNLITSDCARRLSREKLSVFIVFSIALALPLPLPFVSPLRTPVYVWIGRGTEDKADVS